MTEASRSRSVLIVLNGASSAGKTTVAQALKNHLGDSCVLTGLDDILARVHLFGPDCGGAFRALQRGVRVAWFTFNDGRLQLFKRLHREVVALAQSGRAVVVETVLMDKRALRDAAECFAPLHGLFVGIKPPLAVSEQWEAQRADRPRGHARKHYDLVHAHGRYDLVLDTSALSPDECATMILRRLDESPPDAFHRILDDSR